MPGCTSDEGDENGNIISSPLLSTSPVLKKSFPDACFYVHGVAGKGARAGTVPLYHGPVRTPVFMPVGTKGTLKGVMTRQLKSSSYLGLFCCVKNIITSVEYNYIYALLCSAVEMQTGCPLSS